MITELRRRTKFAFEGIVVKWAIILTINKLKSTINSGKILRFVSQKFYELSKCLYKGK